MTLQLQTDTRTAVARCRSSVLKAQSSDVLRFHTAWVESIPHCAELRLLTSAKFLPARHVLPTHNHTALVLHHHKPKRTQNLQKE
jgi:hypothetical protein